MKIGYFTNQYPAVSHTFIRREIQALEVLGLAIIRYALRCGQNLIDPDDLREAEKTRFVLRAGLSEIVHSCAKVVVTRPASLISVFGLAFQVGRRSERGFLRHIAYVLEAILLAEWCRADGVEHIHAHFGTNSACIAMFVSKLSGIPYSFTAHGSEEFEKAPLLSLDKKVESAAFAVCVSSFGKSQLMRWSRPEYWEKIFVVHCGLDRSFFERPMAALPDENKFVCVGRLDEHKAQIVLVAAAKSLRDKGIACQIVLAGDGTWRKAVESAIEKAGLQQHVLITGWLDGENVKLQIESARALILPSFSENMPVVIMEALALGRPAISTFVAGIPELIRPGKSGWLVPAGDVAALAQAMSEALVAPLGQLAKMGEFGRQHIQERHDATREAMKLKTLFEKRRFKPDVN